MSALLRLYGSDELGADGYPPEWHTTIKHLIRAEAGNRCVRCRHPYRNGEHGNGEWSECDELCDHVGPLRWKRNWEDDNWIEENGTSAAQLLLGTGDDEWDVEAHWRILTVHHLNGDKADCRWWNLAALCQRCHLTIQGRVVMERAFIFEHSEWFKPFAAGFYAWKYEGREITREEAEANLDTLLALERLA